MPAPRLPPILAPALFLILALIPAACGSQAPGEPTAQRTQTSGGSAGKPPGASRGQAGRLVEGGSPEAFRRRLASLRGTPVVVNQWASWCGPCRFEFPFFARLAVRYRGRVAFIGVNAQDSRVGAQRFLTANPTSFVHLFDPETRISREFRGGFAWPTTAFYDADGELTRTKVGPYTSQAALERDIRAFALNG